MTDEREALARRFLHVDLNTGDADASLAFFQAVTGLRLVMRSDQSRSDGTLLEIEREVISETLFLYDHRGPRSAPAIELAQWIDPPTHGAVYADPRHPGLHGLIHEVGSLEDAQDAVIATGGTVVGRTTHTIAGDEPRDTLVARDPDGVFVELTLAASPASHGTALGVRASCSDLESSVAWYESIGFDVVTPPRNATLPGILFGLDCELVDVRLARVALAEDAPAYQLCLVSWPGQSSHPRAYDRANHRGLFRCALRVENVEATRTVLDRNAVGYRGPFRVDIPGTKAADLVILFLRDPDGIVMEHVQRPSSIFRARAD